MSIADKLTAIAENEPRVYEAGKLALLRASKYMNATASGTAVAVRDVNPIEHDVAVQLSSNILTDFSAVTVKRYGKNLVGDLSQYTFVTCKYNGDGKLTANFTSKLRCRMETRIHNDLLMANRGKAFTFSLKADTTTDTRLTVVIYGTRTDGKIFQEVNGTIGNNFVTFTVDEEFTGITTLDLRMLEKTSAYTDTETIISELQLELGNTVTGYEPYIEPTSITAAADGAVEGVTCLAPSMTLATETAGVTISCSYLRDIDTYIDNLITDVALTGGD